MNMALGTRRRCAALLYDSTKHYLDGRWIAPPSRARYAGGLFLGRGGAGRASGEYIDDAR